MVVLAFAWFWNWREGAVLGQASFQVSDGVDPGQCAACHQRIAGSKNPDLIFNHGFHLLIACEDCHWEYPHRPDRSVRPTMASCLNCHGLSHGEQGVFAEGGCKACHPKGRDRRPRDHARTWAAKSHVAAAQQDSNSCAMCHTQVQCERCHDAKRIDAGAYALGPYVPLLPSVRPYGPTQTIDPEAPASAGACTPCHRDFDLLVRRGFEKGRLIFKHESHVGRGFRCSVCHPRFSHLPDGIDRPQMRQCYDCHGVKHGRQGTVAGTDCLLCHPKTFDLVPRDHKPVETWLLSHGPIAKKDLGFCNMCHQPSFCEPCHAGNTPLPEKVRRVVASRRRVTSRGTVGPKVIPKDHLTQQWRTRHGKEYLKMDGSCSSCHPGTFCNDCHKTALPHPPNWLAEHSAKGVTREDCNTCHKDRSACQNCHHGGIAGGLLEQKNCVKCHSDAKLPWQQIRGKGMIVHAVHWTEKVLKKTKRRYRCLECHLGFSPELRPVDQAHSYSFDLCRECHGRLDRNSRMIAEPRVGSDLCRRCHPNMLL